MNQNKTQHPSENRNHIQKKNPSHELDLDDHAAIFCVGGCIFPSKFVLLHLVKLSKALADAETTITLNPEWDKGYFRKGCVLEAMERYDDAIAAFQIALQYNSQSAEVSRKIKRLGQLAKDKKRVQELESIRSNIDMGKQLEALKKELSEKYAADEDSKEIFSFVVETMEMTVKSWHETDKVDARVYYLLDKEKTDTEKVCPS
ncbi:hypothetical protein MKW94_010403, partial [Papaver nudicaule]|nr:hypothetical protein [Papaver nudicaule]